MSKPTPQIAVLPFPYGRPLAEVSSLEYESSRKRWRCSEGYIMERFPEHPAASHPNFVVLQHRLVAEALLGRYLRGIEVVHHEDADGMNNHPSNLWLFPSNREHMRHHKRFEKRYRPDLAEQLRPLAADPTVTLAAAARELGCSATTVQAMLKQHGIVWVSAAEAQLDEARVRKALRGRSTLEAAAALGVTHQTLRNRFRHLLVRRASPGFLEAHREEIRNLATRLRDAQLAGRYGCDPMTMNKQIRKWASAAPDEWLDAAAFRRSRLGLGRPPQRKA
jgi:transposase-like protein